MCRSQSISSVSMQYSDELQQIVQLLHSDQAAIAVVGRSAVATGEPSVNPTKFPGENRRLTIEMAQLEGSVSCHQSLLRLNPLLTSNNEGQRVAPPALRRFASEARLRVGHRR